MENIVEPGTFTTSKVKSIEFLDEEIEVVSMRCTPHHYYISNGMVSHNCDTPYTWNYEGGKHEHIYEGQFKRDDYVIDMTTTEVADYIDKLKEEKPNDVFNIIFTGGEPLLQTRELLDLMQILTARNDKWTYDLETNGTLKISPRLSSRVKTINCSPKLASSGCEERHRNKPESIKTLYDSGKAYFKFVVGVKTFDEDVKTIEQWQLDNNVKDEDIYIMPEGIKFNQIVEGTKFLEENMFKGWRITARLHILLHGDKRAV